MNQVPSGIGNRSLFFAVCKHFLRIKKKATEVTFFLAVLTYSINQRQPVRKSHRLPLVPHFGREGFPPLVKLVEPPR